MPITLPAPVPEIPVANIESAAAYYRDHLGFTFDWGDDGGGICGISRDGCRLFLTNARFRAGVPLPGLDHQPFAGPILIWLNLNSKAEVDALYAEWAGSGATILSPPEDKPWLLREFYAADLDGNVIRVFYDFHADV